MLNLLQYQTLIAATSDHRMWNVCRAEYLLLPAAAVAALSSSLVSEPQIAQSKHTSAGRNLHCSVEHSSAPCILCNVSSLLLLQALSAGNERLAYGQLSLLWDEKKRHLSLTPSAGMPPFIDAEGDTRVFEMFLAEKSAMWVVNLIGDCYRWHQDQVKGLPEGGLHDAWLHRVAALLDAKHVMLAYAANQL